MLYFAYGSNMDEKQMIGRCPSARFFCIAKLSGYRLAFTRYSGSRNCGVADALVDENSDVWGVVYEIEDREINILDSREGYDQKREKGYNCYIREECVVSKNGDDNMCISVHTYYAIPQSNPPLPNAPYKNLIVNGAKFWHLPIEYIKTLESIKVSQ